MKIIIIGGGFGGLKLARKLTKKKGFDVTLIDRFNFHQFQPLFYQVATAGLDASDISFPLRKAFHKENNIHFRMSVVKSVDLVNKKVTTNEEEYAFDKLVIATGADTNFFGNQELIDNTFPMKSTLEALQIKYRLLQNMEEALYARTEEDLQKLLTIVVVGGGPTGVEMSGAIADMRRFVLPKDYPEIDFNKMKVYLLEGSAETLATMSEKSSNNSMEYLKKLGVIVKTDTIVKNYDGKQVLMQNGELIDSCLVIWAAGIKGNVPDGVNINLTVKGNRIKVDRFSRVGGFEDIYAIGDVAYMETQKYPHGHPQVASVAIAQGEALGENFVKMQKKSVNLEEFEYHDKGSMATVGRNLAVVDIPNPKLHFKGFFAWMIWMGLHLFLLLGVKNKLSVFSNWIYNYITYDQNLRLIFRPFYRPKTN
ncbi:MAG: NAD(P)/FAD-dependent oxidoreductase [Ginsengibacter sp.]